MALTVRTRLSPAAKPVDLTLDGPPTTLAEFIQLARESDIQGKFSSEGQNV
jgi:hypothetical protein